MFEDIDGTLTLVHQLCAPSTRIIIAYYSHLWEPILKLGEILKLKSRQSQINYIATVDFLNLMDLADFEVISQEQRQLVPLRWFGIGPFINRYIAPLPGIRHWLSLLAYPLSGGFKRWSLMPAPLVPAMLALEEKIPETVRRQIAFRMMVVLERIAP